MFKHAIAPLTTACLLLTPSLFAHAAEPPRISMAILPMSNTGAADDAWFGYAFSEMLSEQLDLVDPFDLISRRKQHALLNDLGPGSQPTSSTPETFSPLAKLFGAHYILTGTYQLVGERMIINPVLYRAETNSLQTLYPIKGRTRDVFSFQSQFIRTLALAAGHPIDDPDESVPSQPDKDDEASLDTLSLDEAPTRSPDAYRLFGQGLEWWEKGRPGMVMETMAKAIEQDPRFLAPHPYYLEASKKLKLEKKAHDQYRNWLDQGPMIWPLWFYIGESYMTMGKPKEAMTSYNRVIELKSDFEPALSRIGSLLIGSDQLIQAWDHLRKAQRFNPRDPLVAYNLGFISKRHAVEDVKRQFARSLDYDPFNVSFDLARREVYGTKVGMDVAEIAAPGQKPARVTINNQPVMMLYGSFGGVSPSDRAKRTVAKLQRLLYQGAKPQTFTSGHFLGRSAVMSGDGYPIAIATAENAARLGLSPEQLAEQWREFIVAALTNQPLPAEKTNSPDALAWILKANERYAAKDLNGAIAACQNAIEINPSFFAAHYDRALMLREKGDVDNAKKSLQKAITILPSSADAHAALASLLMAQGDQTEAMAHYKTCLEIDPNHSDAQAYSGSFK